jgi:Zn-dependent protease/CBS domain-containing protein
MPGQTAERSSTVPTPGFRLGTVLGFEIVLDYSWFIIFALILFSLGGGYFPISYPGLGSVTYGAMALAGALLFFASLLAHELAHAVVARRRGVIVDGITLFVFGGMARMRSEPQRAGDEFVIAGAGPVSSYLMGAGFYLLAVGLRAAGVGPEVYGVAAFLATINIILATFNLLPGFPLDGGRLLRAGLWHLHGDMRRATRTASRAGEVLAYVLMALGVLQALSGYVLGGIWLVFIGWFLRNAAVASYSQLLVRDALRSVAAADLMTPWPDTVPPDLSLEEMVDSFFMHYRHQAYPVVRGAAPVGLVTLEQVRRVPRDDWATRTVADVMTPAADIVVAPDTPINLMLEQMHAAGAYRVLVVGGGALLGIISSSDIASWIRHTRELDLPAPV